MEGTDREEERKREEEKDGNNSGDVTEGKFFGFLLDPFSLLLRLYSVSFSLSSSPSFRVPVNKAVCVQTLLWYPLPLLALSLYRFSPLLFSGEIKAHTVAALTASSKNPPLQKSFNFPPARPGLKGSLWGVDEKQRREEGATLHTAT